MTIAGAECDAEAKAAQGSLSSEQVDLYHRQGFLLIPNFFDPDPVLKQAHALIDNFDPLGHPMTKFSTGGKTNDDDADSNKASEEHVGDRYFLESGDKIRFFLEEDAVDAATGTLNRSPALCVNKCGHALHELDPTFRLLTFSQKVQNVVRSLDAFTSPQCLQSMIICKQPSIGGEVPAHNDSTFLYTSPPSAVGLWFALEDCTTSNGCLSFMPGSHRWPKETDGCKPVAAMADLRRPQNESTTVTERYGCPRGVNKRFVRTDPKNIDAGTSFLTLSNEEEEQEWDESRASTAECKAGTLVLIHGSVMHKSERNRSTQSRFIYTFHCIEGDPSVATYDERNWLQPSEKMPFSQLYQTTPSEAV